MHLNCNIFLPPRDNKTNIHSNSTVTRATDFRLWKAVTQGYNFEGRMAQHVRLHPVILPGYFWQQGVRRQRVEATISEPRTVEADGKSCSCVFSE